MPDTKKPVDKGATKVTIKLAGHSAIDTLVNYAETIQAFKEREILPAANFKDKFDANNAQHLLKYLIDTSSQIIERLPDGYHAKEYFVTALNAPPEQAKEAFKRYIDHITASFSGEKSAQDIAAANEYAHSQQVVFDLGKDPFYLLAQSAASNKLQKKLTERITNPAQLDFFGAGHIESKDFKLHIHLYDKLPNGVNQSAARLLDSLMIQATSEGLKDTLINLPLKDYMTMRDLSDEKTTRAQIKEDIFALEHTSFEYRGTAGKARGAWLRISIAGGTVGQIKNGDIIFRFNQDFYDSFKASDTGKYMYMYFPREALRASIKQRPYTYWLARKIAEHKRINLGKPNADIIGVKTLIDACPNFPTYDAVMRGDRHVTERIIEPFERDMDEINESLSWQYANGQPTDYKTFLESNVLITWKYYPDTKTIEVGRAAHEKKQLPAPRKKKDPRPGAKK